MVFTRPDARGRGLATAVLKAALHEARADGASNATLQSTPMAEGLYLRYGFRPVGRWQEWVNG
jgi:GNAT superfamily N-acetyltransferase